MNEDNFYNTLENVVPVSIQNFQEIIFERISEDHLDAMHLYSTDERLYKYLEFDAFVNVNETLSYIKKLTDRIGNKVYGRTAMYWAIRRKSDKRIIGTMGLLNINASRLSAEWGFGLIRN